MAGRQHKDLIEVNTSAHEVVGHPAQKPVALMRRLLDVAGRRAGTVLDPCADSDTTAVAGNDYGMKIILIERDRQYVGRIKRRFLGGGTVGRRAKRAIESAADGAGE